MDDWSPENTRTDEDWAERQDAAEEALAERPIPDDDPFGADVFTQSWERLGYQSCGGCGADIGVSSQGPWHLPHEDCRAIRDPYPRKEQ